MAGWLVRDRNLCRTKHNCPCTEGDQADAQMLLPNFLCSFVHFVDHKIECSCVAFVRAKRELQTANCSFISASAFSARLDTSDTLLAVCLFACLHSFLFAIHFFVIKILNEFKQIKFRYFEEKLQIENNGELKNLISYFAFYRTLII